MRLSEALKAARRKGTLEIVDRSRGSVAGSDLDVGALLQAAANGNVITDPAGRLAFLLGISELEGPDVLGGRFTPLSLPGLQLWLDVSHIDDLDDGDPMTGWADLSGNGRDASVNGAPLYDEDAGDGFPAVFCDGNDDWFELDDLLLDPSAETFTAGVLHGAFSGTGTKAILSQPTSGTSLYLDAQKFGNNWGGSNVVTDSSYTWGQWRLIVIHWDGARLYFEINGVADSDHARTPASSSSDWRFGVNATGANPFFGAFRELVVCAPCLAAHHRSVLAEYMMRRWDITP